MAETLFSQNAAHLHSLADGNSAPLLVVKSLFPFDFFPTTIVVTKTKIDVVDKLFFFSKDINSFLITEVGRVEVTTNLFFSTLTIRGKTVDKILIKVGYLRAEDAIQVQSIIQGLIIAKTENVDVTQMASPGLESVVRTVGQPLE
jgi:hypothetical protein